MLSQVPWTSPVHTSSLASGVPIRPLVGLEVPCYDLRIILDKNKGKPTHSNIRFGGHWFIYFYVAFLVFFFIYLFFIDNLSTLSLGETPTKEDQE